MKQFSEKAPSPSVINKIETQMKEFNIQIWNKKKLGIDMKQKE